MTIDYTYFGYGAGLVMAGFVGGVVVNSVIGILKALR